MEREFLQWRHTTQFVNLADVVNTITVQVENLQLFELAQRRINVCEFVEGEIYPGDRSGI